MQSSITQKERILSLDIIRGLALFGILLINVGDFKTLTESIQIPAYDNLNLTIDKLIKVFVEKKFFAVFSFLFGVSFFIFSSRAEQRGDKPRWRFTRRLFALLLIGIIHIFIYFGSILAIYAVLGFFLLPFYKAKVPTIRNWLLGMIIAYMGSLLIHLFFIDLGAISAITSFFGNDLIAVFIMFLTGLLAAKANWIRRVKELSTQLKWLQIVTLPIFIGISCWIWLTPNREYQHMQAIIGLGQIPTAYLYLSILFILLENKRIVKLLEPIGRVGQMAFTNYLAQSFIGIAIISAMGLEYVLPLDKVIIAVMIFVIQIMVSIVWFKFFKVGPFEKVWRIMTYGRKVRKQKA